MLLLEQIKPVKSVNIPIYISSLPNLSQATSPKMSVKTEVTCGVFDPRTYREADPVNWARKRRSDWLAIPGKIHYVRERTVDSQERDLEAKTKKEGDEEQQQEKAAEDQSEPIIQKKQEEEIVLEGSK